MILTFAFNLNLNTDNAIDDNGITYLYKALHFQENSTMKRGIKGLLRLTLKVHT